MNRAGTYITGDPLSDPPLGKVPFAPMEEIEVRRITATDVLPLRRKVLRQGMPPETAIFPGDQEPETFHLGAFRQGDIVGVATFLVRPYPMDASRARGWQLRGMAVDPELQSHGVGSKMLDAAIEILGPELRARDGVPVPAILWCKARIKAVDFYRRNGWVTVGEEFEIAPIGPHYHMKWQPTT
ncbi:MAG TPA: GNAT family N-acetyltransferase [bacterium]|nr:GNAT family N-acetyltransferase [bacterium]